MLKNQLILKKNWRPSLIVSIAYSIFGFYDPKQPYIYEKRHFMINYKNKKNNT